MKNASMLMQPLGNGNTGIMFKAQNTKDLPDNVTTVWTPANPEETEAIFNNNQLKYANDSSNSPIGLLNEKITIDYPLPEDKNCSYLKIVRFGVRQGGTFIINFYPENSNHPNIVLSKSTYFRIFSDMQKIQ